MVGVAHAAIDTYEFAKDGDRERFRELTKELRCPKCQNQDIADSNAPIAADLRKEIFRMLGEGKDNQQIIDFMVDRYGDFVRYKPALTGKTALLWFGPAGLLLTGLVVMAVIVRRRRVAPADGSDSLSVDERQRLDQLFLLIPVLRGRRAQLEEDRTALNVALYQERVAELQTQQSEGVLDAAQLDSGRAEAARELLADTEGVEKPRELRLGKPLPLLAAFLVPVLGVALYLHYGASDKVELTREFSQPPVSMEDMTRRLERAAAAQPDSPEGLYFLGRAYMAQDRSADAAKIFERTVALAGRQPELLGQWAQAQYFADNKQWSPKVQALTDEALKLDPKEVTSLGLLGIAAFEGQRYQEAIDYWNRLLAQLPPDDNSRAALQGGIDRAAEKLKESGGSVAPVKAEKQMQVQVDLAADVKAKALPTDSVFIFARAVKGPPAPLAAKRVTVADLPITVELGDSDAMMPQLKLSNFPEVQLVARISRAGVPTAGEWIGRSQPLEMPMTAIARITLLSLVLGLSACAVHRPPSPTGPTIPPTGPSTQPSTQPSSPVIKPSKPVPSSSPTFAPPPGAASHWDGKMQVYVLDEQPDTFYRQRTYYRWSNGWSRSISPNGPWEETDVHGVPPGLSKQYAQ
eukprot:gene8904-10434_t